MFSKIREFAQRHQRKFLFAGVMVGGGILLKKYAEQKLLNWQEKEVNQLLERSRKQQHFESTEKTCNVTIGSVIPQVQTTLSKALDSDSITLLLKNKAPNKKDLWEQLKIISFSRIISYIYSHTMLVILLRTQVNILGAYLYVANQNPSNPELELNPELQNQFLSASNFSLSTGMEQFCSMVEKVVSSQVKCLSLKDRVTLIDLERILHDIHIAIDSELGQQSKSTITDFMLPPPESYSNIVDKMMSETREILESSEVRELLTTSVRVGLTCVLDKLADSMPVLSDENNTEFVHPNSIGVYVAKLIPVLNNFIYQDVWNEQLLRFEPLRTYGANIYESFSSQNL